MGLWNFMKESGKSLFGGGDEKALTADVLQKEVADLGLDADGLDISVEGDTVKVSGAAVSQEAKEKVILANWSGHGLLDLGAYEKFLAGQLSNFELPEGVIADSEKVFANYPKPAHLNRG